MENQQYKNDIDTVMAYAKDACHKFNLKEVCSKALLYGITDDMNCQAYEALVNAGLKVSILKAALTKLFKEQPNVHTGADKPLGVSVEGLIALHGLQYGTAMPLNSMLLIISIIKTNNTAASRILKAHHISLTHKNELIYKPLF